MSVLSVNAGSSSLKFALYKTQASELVAPLVIGQFERLQVPADHTKPVRIHLEFTLTGQEGVSTQIDVPKGTEPFDAALTRLKDLIGEITADHRQGAGELAAIAHRVVHGGDAFKKSVLVTPSVLRELSTLSALAPLHQPHNIAGIEAFQKSFPSVAQVACFDTSFHATMSPLETTFAIGQEHTRAGIRRYGFHGLSYQFITGQLGQLSQVAHGRCILAHLGNGASLCATRQAKSVATTMGFSALDGLMMGTRSGSIDAGVVLHWMRQGHSAQDIEQFLYKESGLLGVSGVSADVRTLRSSPSEQARFALDLFTHRVLREMGAMCATLGGVDLICFTGGIGEHDAILRKEVCESLEWLGVLLDEQSNHNANTLGAQFIHAAHSRVEVWVIPTDEGRVAAQEALDLIHNVPNF
jgi:acetate kinase